MPKSKRIAKAEMLLMREALQQGRAYEAVPRAARLMRFAEQIRAEGMFAHYLAGRSIISMALEPLREYFPRIQDPRALGAIVALARIYEQHRTPLTKAHQHQYYAGLSLYRDLATRRLRARHLREFAELAGRTKGVGTLTLKGRLVLAGVGIPFVPRPSLKYHAQLRAELSEPLEQRQPTVSFTVKRYLNWILLFPDSMVLAKEPVEVASVRLLGCAAAVRLYRLRTGKYLATLEA